MKKLFELGFVFAVVACLTGCIEVTRGYKSTTLIKVEGESSSKFTASPELTISADKDYSDLLKANTDASQNKAGSTPAPQTTPEEKKEDK